MRNMYFDTVIRQGCVFDGVNPGIVTNIGILNGRIAAIGQGIDTAGAQVIDAQGLWVTPGFVDIHTHYDLEVEISPGLPESLRHGTTTVVMGNCSLSAIYGTPNDIANIFSRVETLLPELISGWLRQAKEWPAPKSYVAHFDDMPLGANVACLLGHSALRVKAMGLERSLKNHATPDDIVRMRKLAEEALDAGCMGISVDMVHWHKVDGEFAGIALPSHHASYNEYAMLADVCRQRDAVFQVIPNPGSALSFLNILRLAPGLWRAPLRLTILSALDIDGAPWLWHLYSPILFVCNRLLGCNIRFQTLAKPFTIYGDGPLTPLFEEFSAGVLLNNCKARGERESLWKKESFRDDFSASWKSGWPRTFHRDLYRMMIVSAPDSTLNGQTIGTAADKAGEKPLDYFMALLAKYDEDLRWVATGANARDKVRHKLMQHPHILPGFSDAGAHGRNLAYFDNAISVLRQALINNFLPIHKAIARVTAEPARWFNLDSGYIKIGAKADIAIIDPELLRMPEQEPITVSDATIGGSMRMVNRDTESPVRHVFANGIAVVHNGNILPAAGTERLGVFLPQMNPARSAHEALARHRNRVSDELTLPHHGDYWEIFLLKHRDFKNVLLHCVGFVLMYAIPFIALIQNDWKILLLWPLSQITGLIGHWFYEPSPIDTRDTVFSWRAFSSLHKMFFCVMTGRYRAEQLRAEKHLATE